MEPGRRIKLVRIVTRLNVGGPAFHCWALSDRLGARGFDTLLAAGSIDSGEMSYDRLKGAKAETFRRVRIPEMGRGLAVLGDCVAFARLFRLLRRERPLIVHTHTAKAGLLGRAAAVAAGVPVVVHTFHGHVLRGYFPGWLSWVIATIERFLARRTTVIVTLSDSLREELSRRYRIAPSEKFRVIPLGRDLRAFEEAGSAKGALRKELGIPDERVVLIGAVGRLVPIKNIGLLLDALSLMSTKRPWRCLLVGEGPLRSELEARARGLGLGEQVHFLGWRADIPGVLADLDLVVNSSRNEGTPLSLIEAFAAGRPAVATRVGGVEGMFQACAGNPVGPYGVRWCAEGATVPDGSADALAWVIERLVEEDSLRERAGAAAKETAKAYGLENLVERVAALYQALLEERSA